jgi:hypothetical protein
MLHNLHTPEQGHVGKPESEYESLLGKAGLRLLRVVQTGSAASIVEAVLA